MFHQRLCVACMLFVFLLGCSEPNATSVEADASSSTDIRTELESKPESVEPATQPSEEAVPLNGTASSEGGWGNLKGRFVYDGPPPPQPALVPTKDLQVCGEHDLFNESLIVNEQNNGIQNVVVFVYTKRGAPLAIHESYRETETAKVHLDNEWCRFNNHITVLRTTQTLLVRNLDAVGHNTKIDAISNVAINPILAANSELEHQFKKAERAPLAVSCSIHPWMNGYVFVKDHPYVAVTDANGEFELQNLPSKQLTFQAWQEKTGFITDVVIAGKDAKWKRGRFDKLIVEGTTELGDITVAAEQFE